MRLSNSSVYCMETDATRIIFHTLPLWMRLGPHHARCFVQYILHHFSSLWRPPDRTLQCDTFILCFTKRTTREFLRPCLLLQSYWSMYMVLFSSMTIWGICGQCQPRSAARFAHANDVYYSCCIYPLHVVFVWNINMPAWPHNFNERHNLAQHCG